MACSLIKVLCRCNKYTGNIRNDKSTAFLQFGNRSLSDHFGARPTDDELIKLQTSVTDKKEIGSKAMRAYLERAKQHDLFMKQQLSEYNIGKRHLANMMGEDPETFTQKEIDLAIEYLFPSGLYDPKARPLMKPPEEVFPQRKEAEFDESGRPHHFLFYTGRPNLYKLLYEITDHLEALNDFEDKMLMKCIPPDANQTLDLIGSEWISQVELEKTLVETIIEKEYKNFIASMERLVEHPYSYRLKEFIGTFRKPLMRQTKVHDIPTPINEADGSSYVTTKECLRKSARGEVTVRSPGTGLITINGQGIEYFADLQPREQLLFPLTFTGLVDTVNIEATVKGGGPSGQAGAIRWGIAWGLRSFVDTEMVEKMRLAGLLTRDSRVRERKKPGQAKARKKFTWKKR